MSSWPLLLAVAGAAASPLPSSLWRPLARIRRRHDDGQPRPPPASQLDGLPRRLAYRALHCFAVGEVMHDKVAVFMVGLPGAGKSRVIDLRYVTDHRNGCRKVNSTCIVDLDREIAEHPQYDPADPDKLYLARGQDAYRWADARVEERFLNGLADPRVRRLVVDGTGTNVERQVRRMEEYDTASLPPNLGLLQRPGLLLFACYCIGRQSMRRPCDARTKTTETKPSL